MPIEDTQSQPSAGIKHHDQSTQDLGEPVRDFNKLPAKTLTWLDRNLSNALGIGAFDEAVDNIKSALHLNTHEIGERLVRSAQTIANHPEGSKLLDFMEKARQHGGDAFDAASSQINAKADNGQMPKELWTCHGFVPDL